VNVSLSTPTFASIRQCQENHHFIKFQLCVFPISFPAVAPLMDPHTALNLQNLSFISFTISVQLHVTSNRKQEVLGRTNRLLSFNTTCAAYETMFQTIPLLLHVHADCQCRGNVFTMPLPSNDRGIHIEAQTDL
jgi:hypothetical protein